MNLNELRKILFKLDQIKKLGIKEEAGDQLDWEKQSAERDLARKQGRLNPGQVWTGSANNLTAPPQSTPAPAPAAAPVQQPTTNQSPPPQQNRRRNRNRSGFNKAYGDARARGEKEFTWNGKRYNSELDTNPVKGKPANPVSTPPSNAPAPTPTAAASSGVQTAQNNPSGAGVTTPDAQGHTQLGPRANSVQGVTPTTPTTQQNSIGQQMRQAGVNNTVNNALGSRVQPGQTVQPGQVATPVSTPPISTPAPASPVSTTALNQYGQIQGLGSVPIGDRKRNEPVQFGPDGRPIPQKTG